MNQPKVILRNQPDYNPVGIAANAVEIIEGISLDVRGKTVLVKPSFVYPSRSEAVLGVITHPDFVVGVIKALREKGARRVLLCESSIMGPSRVSFHTVGILPKIAGLAEPVYLDEEEAVEVEVPDPFVQRRFRVPKIWLDADVYVTLPKIKTNMFAELTLSVKNNLGMLRQRERLIFHDYRLHKKLADLYKVRKPEMTIADCVVAGEGQGPLIASPVAMGLMIGGNNAVAADVVSCHMVGYKTTEIEHLDLLIKAGYGPATMDGIDIDGRDLLQRARKFARPDPLIANLSPRLKVFQGTEHFCPWGCAGLIRGIMDVYVRENGAEGIRPMNVIVGKPVNPPKDLDPKITIVVGDCAEPHCGLGEFVAGCSPRPLDIMLPIRHIQGPVKMEVSFAETIGALQGYAHHGLWRLGKMLAGKPLEPIENHLTVSQMFMESLREIGFRLKK